RPVRRQPLRRRIDRRQRRATPTLPASALPLASRACRRRILGKERPSEHKRETEDGNQALHTCPFNQLVELGEVEASLCSRLASACKSSIHTLPNCLLA